MKLSVAASKEGCVVVIQDEWFWEVSIAAARAAATLCRQRVSCGCERPCDVALKDLDGDGFMFGGGADAHAEFAESLELMADVAEQYLPGAGHA